MPKKKPPDPDEKPQSERFKEFAKEVGADSEEAMEKLFRKAVPPAKPGDKSS